MLMDHSPGFDMRHTLISQVETTAQVIICGHLHTGFGNSYIYRRDDDGVLFINPGALCRLSAHATEIERTVQIALLTVENGQAEAELIPLKSAAPGHEVLSRAHLEAEAERSERLERFLNLLASEGEVRFLETREIIDEIAARENILGEVKVEALKRIARAREELGAA
jgi:exonuclease SbcD